MQDSNRWHSLSTEARNPRSQDLDRLEAEQLVELLIEEDRRGLLAARAHSQDIATVAEWVCEALCGDRLVLFVGAGTSGRLGVLEAAECPPTFGTSPHQIRAAIAGGESAIREAVEGAEDDVEAGALAASDLSSGDVCIAISASSVTPFPLAALRSARSAGARTVLLTCAMPEDVETLTPEVDLVIALGTGPEILSGSTRLKAGSATKAALNAITTAAMVKAGKVYQNLMVDLRQGSAKLEDRAIRITAAATGLDTDAAKEALAAADGNIKVAIVMQAGGVDREVAMQRLEAAGGHVGRALEA